MANESCWRRGDFLASGGDGRRRGVSSCLAVAQYCVFRRLEEMKSHGREDAACWRAEREGQIEPAHTAKYTHTRIITRRRRPSLYAHTAKEE